MAFSASYGRDYDEKMLDEAVAAYLIAKHKPPAEARLKALRHRYGVLSSALLHSDLYEVERKALLAHKRRSTLRRLRRRGST